MLDIPGKELIFRFQKINILVNVYLAIVTSQPSSDTCKAVFLPEILLGRRRFPPCTAPHNSLFIMELNDEFSLEHFPSPMV